MGLGYNKKTLYPRPIILAKRYMPFYRCHGTYMFDKLVRFLYLFILNDDV